MKTEIRKILADKTETLEDGRVVIVPDFSQLDDLVDDLDTLFSLHVVSQAKRTVCPKCGDYGWIYNDDATSRKICPCHY